VFAADADVVVPLLPLLCASACCDIWVCIPRIIAADAITAIIAAAAMIAECFFIVFVFLLSFNFFR
jgi:hypothetical protein